MVTPFNRDGSVNGGDFRGFWNGVLQRGGWWDVSARYSEAVAPPPRLPRAEEPRFDPVSADKFDFHLVPFSSVGITEGQGRTCPGCRPRRTP
ncbi:MAG: hypothetical protein IIC24_12085 [Chloroflexi bacterium]|nr:hypothetical protein [Chloroflexota bacterium]